MFRWCHTTLWGPLRTAEPLRPQVSQTPDTTRSPSKFSKIKDFVPVLYGGRDNHKAKTLHCTALPTSTPSLFSPAAWSGALRSAAAGTRQHTTKANRCGFPFVCASVDAASNSEGSSVSQLSAGSEESISEARNHIFWTAGSPKHFGATYIKNC